MLAPTVLFLLLTPLTSAIAVPPQPPAALSARGDDDPNQWGCPNNNGCLCKSDALPGRYCGSCQTDGTNVVIATGQNATTSDMFYCGQNGACCKYNNETCGWLFPFCEWKYSSGGTADLLAEVEAARTGAEEE